MSATTVVNNPDGTISLNSTTSTLSYLLDVNRKFIVSTSCNHSNVSYSGATQNGLPAYKGSVVEVQVSMSPGTSAVTPVPARGVFQVWRSTDLVFTWDPSKLEFIGASSDSFLTDANVVNASKISLNVLKPGIGVFHSEANLPPHLRTPKGIENPFEWNLGGYIWGGGSRNLGKLRFRVISDFYYPTDSPTDIKMMPEVSVDGITFKSKVDGGASAGTDVTGDLRNNANKIKSGPAPDYKVSLSLTGPVAPAAPGADVPVRVSVAPETLPQTISSVVTMFAWDNTKLEFMGFDKTGAKPSMSSSLMWVGAGKVNESSIPKDGTASHTWLCMLGDKAPLDKEALLVTLKFKALTSFAETKIEIINKADPRVAGLTISDDTGVLGSCVPGSNPTGTLTHAVIKGVQ